MTDITQILSKIEAGDPDAAEQLLPQVYQQLRKLAAIRLGDERSSETIQATDLVHEAYLRLVDVDRVQHWNSRGHFFAAAAEAMRRILVERARRKHSLKRGGGLRRISLTSVDPPAEDSATFDLLALNDALLQLEEKDSRKAELVKLRFFAGLTNEQAASAMGISSSTADNYWAYARSWLRVAMSETLGEGAN